MKAFERFHPIILFFYFVVVIFITMFTMNPVLVGVSLITSVVFFGMLAGIKKVLGSLKYSIPIMILIAITNPIFVHRGETELFYLNGNPVTLEAIIYGVVMSAMIMAIIYWFRCYTEVMTSDKFIYLFGRVIPKISLMLSMVLRFVPKFTAQFKAIDESQKALGIYATKSVFDRIKSKFRVISVLITWSLENSIETSDSMRARGYGLKGRTSYSIFKWGVKDSILSVLVLALSAFVITGLFTPAADYSFYPMLGEIGAGIIPILLYAATFALMAMTTILEMRENVQWRLVKSKIQKCACEIQKVNSGAQNTEVNSKSEKTRKK